MLPGDVNGFRDDFLQLPSFKSMAEDEWYLSSNDLTPTPCDPLHLLDQSSCSQSPAFPLSAPTMLNPFDLSCESSFGDDCHDAFLDFGYVGTSDLGLPAQFQGPNLSQIPEEASTGFNPFEVAPFLSRPKLLRPLEANPPAGAQPTLFQKRAAALRRGGVAGDGRSGDEEEVDVDGSKGEGGTEDGGGGAEGKGKRKGVLPAKNLMAERRRRKKLNDRLYMLRSVVPKISKMDRASILGDAIDYLKELLQRINDLHNELESAPPSGSALAATSNSVSFHPLTPTLPVLPNRVKEELSSSPMRSPRSQPARVEVRLREGRAVNIHMFCASRPGLLLSTMRALDSMGLDIQQAVISCFNGFALDIFRAEQSQDGPGVQPEEIKAALLHSAGLQGAIS